MKYVLRLSAIVLAVASSNVCRATDPISPEKVVAQAFDAMYQGRIDDFVQLMHPDALAEFRQFILEIVDLAAEHDEEEEVVSLFHGVANADALKELDAAGLFHAMVAKIMADPALKQVLSGIKVKVLGRLDAGDDKNKVYVVYQSRLNLDGRSIEMLQASELRRSGADWKMLMDDDLSAQVATMKQSLQGELPDEASSDVRIEPLGHVSVDEQTLMVVYRASLPPAMHSKLSVLKVESNEPDWDAVRENRIEAIRTLIQKSLGIEKPPSTEDEGVE